MNQIAKIGTFLSILVMTMMTSILSFAQEKKIDVDINTNPTESPTSFFMQPWVWVVGGLIFVLLLVALMRGGGNKS